LLLQQLGRPRSSALLERRLLLPARRRRLLPEGLGARVGNAEEGSGVALEVHRVALERVERSGRVGHVGELNEQEKALSLLLDKPERLEALEGPEDVRHLAPLGVCREALDVEGRGRGFRKRGQGRSRKRSPLLLKGVGEKLGPVILLVKRRSLFRLLLERRHQLRNVWRRVVVVLLLLLGQHRWQETVMLLVSAP
jgi:hypothetical protein